MKQVNSLIRCILDFYNLQRMENPVVLERMKEGNSEEWVMDRLERAIFNDCDKEAKATHSRYAIWGEDIRSLTLKARNEMIQGNCERAGKLLNIVINSMGAFIDAQVMLSNKPENTSFIEPAEILESYIEALKSNNFKESAEIDSVVKRMEELIKDKPLFYGIED